MAYASVLLKLSGEALGAGGRGLDKQAIDIISGQIAEVAATRCRLAVVVGGGNILRGGELSDTVSVRATADQMGMLATMINGLALMDGLERAGCEARLMSAVPAHQICEPFIRRRAIRHQEKGRVVVLAGGTGNPFFTTDTAAALRAMEIQAEVLLKATKVDGVYDKDPVKYQGARKYDRVSFDDALKNDIKVMDSTAFALCRDNNLPIVVFDLHQAGNVKSVVSGRTVGTIIQQDKSTRFAEV